jgi:hypothetical protein
LLRALKASVMIPMHYFSLYTLQCFLDRAREESWQVEGAGAIRRVVARNIAGHATGSGAAGPLKPAPKVNSHLRDRRNSGTQRSVRR